MILEAAGPLFGERGYQGTRLDEIATAAGVTKPILYRHFGSKAALYLELLERHRADLASFASLVPAEGDLRDRLRTVLDAWLAYVEDHPYAWRMLFRDTGGGPEIRGLRMEVQARARAALVELIASLAQARLRPGELVALAELMRAGMASLVLWWMDDPGLPREQVIDAMIRVWAGLLSREH